MADAEEAGSAPLLSQDSNVSAISALAPRQLFPRIDGEERGEGSRMGTIGEEEDKSMASGDENEDDSDEDSSSSEEEGGSGSEENDPGSESDNNEHAGLSSYEKLRLRNIARNEARLAQLGLLGNNGTAASTALLAPSGNAGGANGERAKKKRKKKDKPAAQRRSLPRRRCAKGPRRSLGDGDDDEGGYESDESSVASPVEIRKALRPQAHQAEVLAEEKGLKQYLRTRRMRRGRPKRHEYVWSCDETCKECGGEWMFNNEGNNEGKENGGSDDDEEDVEESTRLIRCKDCRGAFHIDCMLGKSDNGEEDEDRKPAAVPSDETVDESLELPLACDPKRCHRCEAQYRRQKQQQSNGVLSLLEAVVGDRTVRVRVTPEPLLEATRDGEECVVTLSLGGQTTSGVAGGGGNNARKRKRVRFLLEDGEGELPKEDAATTRVRKLIARALAEGDDAKLQERCCEALQSYLDEETAAIAVKLGAVRMLVGAMERHPDRPMLQVEALCTLSDICWMRPDLGMETINAGSLELAVASMKRHGVQAEVQEMACAYFRSLSYDGKCCKRLEALGAVEAVVESIGRNPTKVDVITEGSMFLQNMMVVATAKTARAILGPNKGRRGSQDHPAILSILLKSVKENPTHGDLAFAVFGLLSNIAADTRGRSELRSLGADTLATKRGYSLFD